MHTVSDAMFVYEFCKSSFKPFFKKKGDFSQPRCLKQDWVQRTILPPSFEKHKRLFLNDFIYKKKRQKERGGNVCTENSKAPIFFYIVTF